MELVSKEYLTEMFAPVTGDCTCPLHIAAEIDQIIELAPIVLELTENEVLALKAVAYGCNINSELMDSKFIENTALAKPRTISFYDALMTIYSVIDSIEKAEKREEE